MNITLIRVTIAIESSWAVGGVALPDAEVDLPVQRDPRGSDQAHLPATALVGSLRAHLGEPLATTWFGPALGGREVRTGTRELAAGRARALGAVLTESRVNTRGRTAVDRGRRAADEGMFRQVELVDPSQVTFALEVEHPSSGDLDIGELRDLIGTWQPAVGRGRSAGMGHARVTDVRSLDLDLSVAGDLTWWLTGRRAWLLGLDSASLPPGRSEEGGSVDQQEKSDTQTVHCYNVTVTEPIHVGTGEEVAARAPAPTLASANDFVIPGASWRGVFRHRIEHILDAVGATPTERDAIIEELFGSLASGRGALAFSESRVRKGEPIIRTHVAIDRFTGGARDTSLFSLQAIPPGATLTLRITAPMGTAHTANLLQHVLRDLHDGLIGVGGHGSRGYGSVRVTAGRPTVEPVVVTDLLTELRAQPAATSAQRPATSAEPIATSPEVSV